MKTYAIARLDEIDALADGRYHYRPVRHHFGITSFGVTAWVGAAAGDPIYGQKAGVRVLPGASGPGVPAAD